MNQTELQERLRRAADELAPIDIVDGSLRAAHRIRVRRRRGTLAAASGVVVALVVAVTMWARTPETAGPLRPSPSQSPSPSASASPGGPKAVHLDRARPGTLPAYDRIDEDHVFHGSDGRTFTLASPGTITDVGDAWVDLPTSLVVLHHTSSGYGVAIDGGVPRPILAVSGEDYRALSLGPRGTAFMSGAPGELCRSTPAGR